MGGGRFPCLRFAEVAPCRSPQRAKRRYPRNPARPARGVPLGAAVRTVAVTTSLRLQPFNQ